ncbi:hypothetical protein BD410DRAFT_554205 [Rickenella mellea]|uniref:Uncharacterized protein n=1 Tax=Rickenella mellea TaxID=50990 RepID=A0A4Y7PPF3_9AGAM|nr:hypothetical protein BD410DRAFT_554205 [Rickenella mellea]
MSRNFTSPFATITQAGVFVTATLISSVVVILALLINSSTQSSQSYVPDPTQCTCDCWDRKFKGGYAHGGYKHAYFQMDFGTSLVWIWTAWNFALLFEFVKRATVCVLSSLRVVDSTTHVRWGVLLASIINFYGMFYNWWITFNYLNDLSPSPDSHIHILAYTQFFFNITDLIPALALYILLPDRAHAAPSNSYELTHERDSPPDDTISTTGKGRHQNQYRQDNFLSLSVSISAAHVILSLWDQGLVHILRGKGAVGRDVSLLASDMAGLLGVSPFLPCRWHHWHGHSKNILVGTVLMCGMYAIVKNIAGYDE